MQVYWASVLAIPHGISSDIHHLIRGFLWCNGDLKRGKAKVAWNDICLPKQEGGLGLLNLEVFNLALMTTHIWNIVTNKESLWVRWIHAYKIWGRTLWDIQPKGTPNLSSIAVSSLVNSSRDCFCWRDSNGNLVVFSVRLAWEVLMDSRTDVTWYRMVWFLHWIPRHAFHMWLVMRRSLKTQDKLRPWDVAPNTDMSSFRFLDDIFLWFQSLAHSRSFKAVVGKLIVAASSYFIWNERNNRFKNTARVKELLALWKMPISDYARVLVEVSADKPLIESVDIDIPREDGKGYITANVRIEFEWQPPRCGKKGKGKQVSTQRYIKRYRVNIPKSKLVYRAVVKPQGAYNVASNMEQSLDTTKKPSPVDSSKNGMSTFINDDICLEELRTFVDNSMQEESVLEQVGNYDINGCTSREKQGEKVSSKKSSSSLEILNEDSDTDVDEVFVPKVRTTFPSSSGGGGHQLEEDAYDDYEDQFEDYPSLHQEFCDQFDFKVKGLGRK
ncbi:homeodomain-like protein [Tanacetum coccineum]